MSLPRPFLKAKVSILVELISLLKITEGEEKEGEKKSRGLPIPRTEE